MSATLTMNPAIHRKPLPGRTPPPVAPSAYSVPQQAQQYAAQQQYYQRPRGDTQSTMASQPASMMDHRASSIYSAATGGAVMLIGMGTPIQTLPVSAAALREVDLLGVFRYARTYEYGLELLANKDKYKLPDVGKLATHTFKGLDKVPEAFAAAGKPVDEEGKLVLKVIIQS